MTSNLTLESLQLPQDLFWNGKMEPSSPPSDELFPISESENNWLFEDNFANDIFIVEEFKDVDIKNSPIYFEDNLDHGEEIVLDLDFDVKEEPWPEVKPASHQPMIDLEPFYSNFSHPSMVTKVQNPYEGDSCSKSYFNNPPILLTQLTPPQSPPQQVLTPPQSPPQERQEVKEIFDYYSSQQVVDHQQYQQPTQNHAIQQAPVLSNVFQSLDNLIPSTGSAPAETTLPSVPATAAQLVYTQNAYSATQSSVIAQNCQIVDEIVETRAKELSDWNDDTVYNEFIRSTSVSSPQSHSADEDWGRTSPSNSSSSLSSASSVTGDSFCSEIAIGGGKSQTSNSLAKKRTRPYGRGVEDRKIRKKEQNKNAATRYRQKKKQEMEVVLNEEQQLSNRHKELLNVLSDRKREAEYLKKLIREFHQNRKL